MWELILLKVSLFQMPKRISGQLGNWEIETETETETQAKTPIPIEVKVEIEMKRKYRDRASIHQSLI